jgi:hypothetical protein
VCLKPTKIFNEFKGFAMFFILPSHPQGKTSDYPKFNPFFMTNVRYYGHDMDKSLWDAGNYYIEHYFEIWGWEMLIHNNMIHYQHLDFNRQNFMDMYHLPHLNYQLGRSGCSNAYQRGGIETAHIVHFASSHGTRRSADRMLQVIEENNVRRNFEKMT